MTQRNSDPGLQRAIKAIGTKYKLAKALGLTPATVQEWRRIPYERILDVERVTGVPREQLRPELYRK